VPLSEHEQRLLDQIEQALYAEDPKFASAVRSARARSRRRRWIVISVLGVFVGLATILVGLAAKLIVLGVLGFVLIVAACGYATAMLHGRPAAGGAGRADVQARRPAGLRTRMEERLRRRFDES
jgi:Protein of unknown function (DUF3040)